MLLLPLCLLKDISKMSISNIFAVLSLLFVIITVAIQAPSYYSNFLDNHQDEEINWFKFQKSFNSNLDFFKGMANTFFAFFCQTAAIPVFLTLKNNIGRRIRKVFRRSIILDFISYLIIGITGFLSVPVNTPAIIIERESITENDYLMLIARIGMAISLALSIPCIYSQLRISLLELIYKSSEVTNSK